MGRKLIGKKEIKNANVIFSLEKDLKSDEDMDE
jgi:hypothetical protein